MKKHCMRIVFTAACLCLLPAAGLPCTTFMLDNDGQPVYGKNMDWREDVPCYVLVNKRGVAKTSMTVTQEPDAKPISWTSNFGSVTFNCLGREFPFEGINEAGLFVSTMGLPEDTGYPLPDSRAPLHEFQWVQYQLDNFSSVDEIMASQQNVRLPQQGSYGFHYLVGDSTGNCASIEWLDGKMVYHAGETMPYKVLANSTYDESVDSLKKYWGFGGLLPVRHPLFYRPSLMRFAIAADRVKKYSPQRTGDAVDHAFRILQDVEVARKSAVWSVVYDTSQMQINFRSRSNNKIRQFNMNAFDFSCAAPVKALDINAELAGDVTDSFVDYTREVTLEMLQGVVPPMSDEAIEYFADYPDTTVCTEE